MANYLVDEMVSIHGYLPPITDDDCNVILQDWEPGDPDQRVAMRLAAEVLTLREAARKALRAYLTGQPRGDGDVMVYSLDGPSVSVALEALRQALRIK